MSNQWFRMYAEFSSDPKVQMMDESMQRRLVMLLCFRCNGLVTLQDEEVTFLLRISDEEWQKTRDVFIERGFLDEMNNLVNWDKRQFRSDSSALRVREHRNRKKQADVTKCNVTVTSQNRTDTDKEKIYKKNFEDFFEIFPKQRKGNREKAEAAYRQALTRSLAEEIAVGLKSYIDSDEVKRGFSKGAAAWLNDDRWKVDYNIKIIGGIEEKTRQEPKKSAVITL